MDPFNWIEYKEEPEKEEPVDNVARSWQWRQLGINPPHCKPNKTVLENIAEDKLVQKKLTTRCCDLPGYPRSTFLMVFSPDGSKVASTHGNHNVYVSELANGKHVGILKGHPRTPWCISFHPSHPQLIASGCLGGQVRVWDLSGGSEVWTANNETVIASLAFHPRDQLLVIATSNELYFWDWGQPAPFTKVATKSINEKVRYVAFDTLGFKLITGIAAWPPNNRSSSLLTTSPPEAAARDGGSGAGGGGAGAGARRDPGGGGDAAAGGGGEPGGAQDMIVNSYQYLVQRYDSLVRNYQRLFMARYRLSNATVSTNTTDRGTDPMEPETSPRTSNGGSSRRHDNLRQDAVDNEEADISNSRLLNLDDLSINSDPARSSDSNPSRSRRRRSPYRSHAGDTLRQDISQRMTRLLPNPFSASSYRFRGGRASLENNAGSSRTSVFTSRRMDSPAARYFMQRRRNATQNNIQTSTSTNTSPQRSPPRTHLERARFPSRTTTNSSTQMSPNSERSINESLDLIRDILRDSGTRLLNLITNMSLSTIASVQSSGEGSAGSRRGEALLSSRLRRTLALDSDSESVDSDAASTPAAPAAAAEPAASTSAAAAAAPAPPTNRLVVQLHLDHGQRTHSLHNDTLNRINVSIANNRFRVRSQSNEGNTSREARNRTRARPTADEIRHQENGADVNPDRPSTSRDTGWMNENPSLNSNGDLADVGPEEAYRRVRLAVNALYKHTVSLTEIWLRGTPMSMHDLRNLWENLRRRVLSLQRQAPGRQDAPSYYTRSLLERCRLLPDVVWSRPRSRGIQRSARMTIHPGRSGEPSNEDIQQTQGSTDSTSSSVPPEEGGGGGGEVSGGGEPAPRRLRWLYKVRSAASARRRLHATYRWRWSPREDEPRRRARTPAARSPPAARTTPRTPRPNVFALELNCTRNEIRMRAMQVLSSLFNMMVNCLEERGLSQLIIQMLKMLKKALAVTCLILMTDRVLRRENEAAVTGNEVPTVDLTSNNENETSSNNNNETDQEPPNEEETPLSNSTSPQPDTNTTTAVESNSNISRPLRIITSARNYEREDNDSVSTLSLSDTEEEIIPERKKFKKNCAAEPVASTSRDFNEPSTSRLMSPPPRRPILQHWSDRVAVQIADANRNTSATAKLRRELYMECKKAKALHRTNPAANPISKRILPPIKTSRIPAIRVVPKRRKPAKSTLPKFSAASNEPVAGPSNSEPRTSASTSTRNYSSRSENTQEFEHRVGLFRIAHMQAARIRSAARHRFRRLQTIRLYSPSSVREMFTLQSNNSEGQSSNQQMNNSSENSGSRRPIATYRPHILTMRNDVSRGEVSRQFENILNNVAVPLDTSSGSPSPPPQRLPRVHEYLQPIILAQNMVVEDGSGGSGPVGGALGSLLDAGIVSEALPASTHRVQAWDFTAGQAPNIADSSKNIVVSRCRIHNDASIDISKDGRILVALLPVPRLRNANHWLGVYSLEWGRLGQCLYTAVLEQSAVSVALSPSARHLAVGLGSRRFTTLSHARSNVFALLYRLSPLEGSSNTGLVPIKELEQNWEQGFTSLNCLRWAPQPGQGLVYANNTGQLIIMS